MTRSRLVTVIAGAVLACASVVVPERSITLVHAAQTLVVNTTADTGACPGATCSLRGAVNRANSDGSGDTITFNIPSTDAGCYGTPVVCHIMLANTLPLKANSTTIDGYSQPGATKNTLGMVAHGTVIPGTVTQEALGTNADLRIQVMGGYNASTCGPDNGFDITGHFNAVQGLAMIGFCNAAILLDGPTAYGNKIQGNFLGVDTSGKNAPNFDFGNRYGVEANTGANPPPSSASNTPDAPAPHSSSGPTPTTNQLSYPDVIGGAQNWQLNILSNNRNYGVYVFYAAGINISHNLIGTSREGKQSSYNSDDGVEITDSSHITVGGPNPQYRNIISGNNAYGLSESYSDHVVVAANIVGLAITGTSSVGNESGGLYMTGGENNTVGLSPLGTQLMGGGRNLISGNSGTGISLIFESNPVIQFNWVGVDITGNAGNHNDGNGIYLQSIDRINGTGVPGKGAKIRNNVLSGNDSDGIDSQGDYYDVIRGNFVGSNYRGTISIPNRDYNVRMVDGSFATVGGTAHGNGNVLSGTHDDAGLYVYNETLVTIQGNKVGVDLLGQHCLSNGDEYPEADHGIGVYNSTAVSIGGTDPAAANVVGCNGAANVKLTYNYVDTSLSSANQFPVKVIGNYIGTNGPGSVPAGTNQLPSYENSLDIDGDQGDLVQGNTIAFSNENGIAMDSNAEVKITRNSIYANAILGIDNSDNDSVDCPTASDSNTAAVCPVITGATPGSVSGTAPSGEVIEVFIADNASNNTDPTHAPDLYGEGKTYLGTATTGPGGHWTVAVPSGMLSSGQFVTATGTVPASGGTPAQTSEFSKNMQVS